jgi:hypothetical protein
MNKRLIILLSIGVMMLAGGCGMVSLLTSPTSYEKKVPAQYNLSQHQQQKLLVLVEQPAWLSAETNMRYYLTNALIAHVTQYVKLPAANIVSYDELVQFRAAKINETTPLPVDIAKAMKADLLLYVTIDAFELYQPEPRLPFAGDLRGRSVLIDTASGQRLWPVSEASRTIHVGFDLGAPNKDRAITQLAASAAHCTVRYFYDCPKARFKIADDRSALGWNELDF